MARYNTNAKQDVAYIDLIWSGPEPAGDTEALQRALLKPKACATHQAGPENTVQNSNPHCGPDWCTHSMYRGMDSRLPVPHRLAVVAETRLGRQVAL